MKTTKALIATLPILLLFLGCDPTRMVKRYDIDGVQVTYVRSRPLNADYVDSIFVEKSGVSVEYGDCHPFDSLDYVIETGENGKAYRLVGHHDDYIKSEERYFMYLKAQIEAIEDQRWHDHVRKYYSR
jgi:hypothetical protein